MSLRLAERLSREEMEKSKAAVTADVTTPAEPAKKGKGKARNTKPTAKSGASNKGKKNKKQKDDEDDDDGNESSDSSSSSGSSSSSSSGSSGSSSSGSSISDDDGSGSSSSGSGSSSDDSDSSSDEDDAGQGDAKKKGASKRRVESAKGNSNNKTNESTRSSKRQKTSDIPQSKTPPVPTSSIEGPEDPGYDSDLYYNSEDERELKKKDEVERETIMAERFERRRVWKETMAMLGKTKKTTGEKTVAAASTTKTARGSTATKAKGRKGKNDMEESEEDEEESSVSEADDDEEEDYDEAPRKRSTQTRSSSGTIGKVTDDKDSDIIESDDEDDNIGKSRDRRQKKSMPDSPPCTLADIQRVQIRRADILKWLDEPYLREIIGCYVNYLKGTGENGQPEYWLCEILDVISTEHFSVVDGERVNILLKLRLGNQSKEYGVDRVSNKIVDGDGFSRWLNLLERSRVSPPTMAEAEETYKRIKDIIFNHTYTNEEIIEKIQRRRQRKDIGTKVLAREREEIAEQLLAAQEINDEEQIKICERKLRDIDLRMKLKYKNYNFMVNEINKKNKLKNMTKKAPALTSNMDTMESILARPHLRRPTRPMQLWNSSKNPTPSNKPAAAATSSTSTAKTADNSGDQKKDQAQTAAESTDTVSKMNIEYGDDDNVAFGDFGSSRNGSNNGDASIGTSQSNQAKKGRGMSLLEYKRKKEAGEL